MTALHTLQTVQNIRVIFIDIIDLHVTNDLADLAGIRTDSRDRNDLPFITPRTSPIFVIKIKTEIEIFCFLDQIIIQRHAVIQIKGFHLYRVIIFLTGCAGNLVVFEFNSLTILNDIRVGGNTGIIFGVFGVGYISRFIAFIEIAFLALMFIRRIFYAIRDVA